MRRALPLALVVFIALPGCEAPSPRPTGAAPGAPAAEKLAAEATPPTPSPSAPVAEPHGEPAPAPETVAAPANASPTTADDDREAAPFAPISETQRATLHAGPVDVLGDGWDVHYIASNEIRHDLMFPYIKELGGAYVGVGSDQNNTLAAVARAEYVFLLDIDQRVVDLHEIYAALIAATPEPRALVDRFLRANRHDTVAFLEEALAERDAAARSRIIKAYRYSRETVYRHLDKVHRRTRDGEATSWLSNPEHYAHVRGLYRAGRVRIMPGDLVGGATVQTVARVTADLAVPVRVLYLSNAEEYFVYKQRYRKNVRALVGDARSVVCRTISTKPINTKYGKTFTRADMIWNYQVQPLADFQRRLEEHPHLTRNLMLQMAERDGTLVREAGREGRSLVALPVVDRVSDDDQPS